MLIQEIEASSMRGERMLRNAEKRPHVGDEFRQSRDPDAPHSALECKRLLRGTPLQGARR